MAKLPNADKAIVPAAKITRYLLDLTSKKGNAKARFFLAFGFTIEEWEILAAALKQHALANDVASTRETPDERNPQLRSVWKIEKGETNPSLVTAYPL